MVKLLSGRPNASNKVLEEDGTFTYTWYLFMIQVWEKLGGSEDRVNDVGESLELIELIPITENIPQDDLTPSVVEKEFQDDLSPRSENPLTAAELTQLQNINTETISNTQWAFVGNMQIGSGSAVVASGTRRAPLGTITFPIAFTTAPKMNATIVSGDFILAAEAPATVMLRKITATEFEFFIDLHANAPANRTMTFDWWATI